MAVVLDAVATNDDPNNGVAAGTNLDSTLLTVGSGSNRALLLLINLSNSAVTGLTAQWDALGTPQTLTQIVTVNNGSGLRADIWGLVNPTSGNKTLRVKWTGGGSSDIAYFSLAYTGVDQTGGTTSFPHGTSQSTSTNTPQVTVTSAVGNAAVATFTSASQIGTSPTQTEIYNDDTLTNINAAGQRAAGAASILFQYSYGSVDSVAVVGCDVLAAGGAEFIGPDKYMQRLSEPQRSLLGRPQQPFGALVPAAPFGENINPDKWYQRLSEPQRQKPGLNAALQSFASSFVFTPGVVFEFIGPDKYMQRLSEPQRQKLGLGSPEQQAFAWSNFTPAAAVTPTFGWFTGLSEPVRKPHLLEGAQQFFAIDPSVIPVSQLWWFNSLSEPVRQKLGLNAAAQQFFATDTSTIPVSKLWWFEALSEPVRRLRGLDASAQSFFAFDPNPFPPSFGWYEALSNPVRFARLSPALAPFETFLFPLPPPVPVNFWYQPLSEPQRNKLWLQAALQEAWVGPPRLLPTFLIAVMNAIEQFDTFLGGGTAFNTPTSAETGVVERAFGGSESGVIGDTTSATSGVVSASTSVRTI